MQIKKQVLDEGINCEISSREGITLGSVNQNKWETDFFRIKWGKLILNHDFLVKLDHQTLHHIMDELIIFADDSNYKLLEYQCDISAFNLIPQIEEKGFRLVDTKIAFLSKIEKPVAQKYLPRIGNIVFPDDNDLEGILNLTYKSFTNNPAFFSRFKNRNYFTEQDTARYYATWITNNFKDESTLFAVIKHNDKVISQSSFKPSGLEQGIKLYRAMFVAIDPKYRGYKTHLALTSFLCDQVRERTFYLDSTTQLTNFPIIKNNIRSRRSLKGITMIFYRAHNWQREISHNYVDSTG